MVCDKPEDKKEPPKPKPKCRNCKQEEVFMANLCVDCLYRWGHD